MSTATVAVQFTSPDSGDGSGDNGSGGAGSGASLSAEIDSRSDGLNAGKTSFVPGDVVAILVFRSANVSIESVVCSAGSITGGNQTVQLPKEQDISFMGTLRSSVSSQGTPGSLGGQWMGKSLGSVTLEGDGVTAVASGGDPSKVGVYRATFQSTAWVYYLTSPATLNGSSDYAINVLVTGKVTG